MTKESEAYCKASIAIDNEQYLKDSFCKLRKYRKVLTNPIPSDMDQSPMSYERLARLLNNLNQEIERRKAKYQAVGSYVAKGVLIGVLVGIILYFIYPLLPSNRDRQNISQPQSPQQSKEHNEPSPSASPSASKPDQLKQKSK